MNLRELRNIFRFRVFVHVFVVLGSPVAFAGFGFVVQDDRPCSGESDCATPLRLRDGTVVGQVLHRIRNNLGQTQEYVKDTSDPASEGPLVWSPELKVGGLGNDGKLNWSEAISYCASKNDLGLAWSLPSREDFRVAFYPTNPDRDRFPHNTHLLEVLDTRDRFLWSSSLDHDVVEAAWFFQGHSGVIGLDSRLRRHSLRCVARSGS